MSITVQHQPSYSSVGNVSRNYGEFQTQKEDRQRREDVAVKFALLDKEAQINAQTQNQAHQNQLDTLQAQFDLNQQAKDLESQRAIEQDKDLTEYEYTTKQKMMIDNVNNQISDVKLRDDLTPEEKDYTVQQLEAKKYGVKPLSRPKSTQFPKGQDIGDLYEDPKSPGDIWTRDEKGIPKIVKKAKDSEVMSTKDWVSQWNELFKSMSSKDVDGNIKYPNSDDVTKTLVSAINAQKNAVKISQVLELPVKDQQWYYLKISQGYSHDRIMEVINKNKSKS